MQVNKQPSATKRGPGRFHKQGYRKGKQPNRSQRALVAGQRALERHQSRHRHALTDFVTDKNLARRANRKQAARRSVEG